MGWWDGVWAWVISVVGHLGALYKLLVTSHPNRGGIDFVSFATGINIAQVGWDAFQGKVRYAERRSKEMVGAAHQNLLESQNRIVMKAFVDFCMHWPEIITRWLWHANYVLCLILTGVGVIMIYLNSTCPWDYLLLLPSVIYLAVTYFFLALLLIVLKWGKALIGKVEAQKAVEDFTETFEQADPASVEAKNSARQKRTRKVSQKRPN